MADLNLYPYSLPALEGGEYVLDAWHVMTQQALGDGDLPAAAAIATPIRVDGPRLKLEGGEILKSWPLQGEEEVTPSRLPYLVFKQETLPWMFRLGQVTNAVPSHKASWMALVALKESELAGPGQVATPTQASYLEGKPLSELFRTVQGQVCELVGVPAPVGAATDTCNQLELPLPLVTALVPSSSESGVVAHVRQLQGDEIKGDDDGFVSILLSSRLLEKDTRYHIFLISLQERAIDALNAMRVGAPAPKVRFVALYHYTCKTGAADADFQHRAGRLDRQAWGRGRGGTALTLSGQHVRLMRQKRDGSKGAVAFHGPLVTQVPERSYVHDPKQTLGEVPAPTLSAGSQTLEDISYPAAFELGRLLALSDRSFLTALLEFRRAWQLDRSWRAMRQTRMALQVRASSASAQQKKSAAGQPSSTPSTLDKLLPLEGLASLVKAPLESLANPARMSAASISDGSGFKHLVGRSDVPGLNPAVIAKEKYGITSSPNAMTVSMLQGTTLEALASVTQEKSVSQQALQQESKSLPAPSTPTASTPTGPGKQAGAPKTTSTAWVEGSLYLPGAGGSAKSAGAADGPTSTPPIPETLQNALYELCLLKHVPFTYLVPDARLLPLESLRLFYLDPEWILHLADGALAAATTGSLDAEANEQLALKLHTLLNQRLKGRSAKDLPGTDTGPLLISGLLLRSSLLRSNPRLEVRGFEGAASMPVLRRDALGEDCLLVLFRGRLDKLELREPVEGLCYGALPIGSSAKLAWQSPSGSGPDNPGLQFGQWDATAKTLDLWRSRPQSLVSMIDPFLQPGGTRVANPAQYQTNAHHVAWALQRDPYVFTLDRNSPEGTSGSGLSGGSGGSTGGGKGDVQNTVVLPDSDVIAPEKIKSPAIKGAGGT